MIIDIEDIINYSSCPMYYKFNIKIKDDVKDTNILFDEIIHSSLYSFLKLCKSNNKLLTLGKLNQIFINKCGGTDVKFEDIISNEPVWGDELDEKRKLDLLSLNNFYKILKRQNLKILAVDNPYKIKITNDITIKGTIDLVLQYTNKHRTYIRLIDFKTNSKTNYKEYAHRDFSLTCSAFAFEKMYDQKIDDCILYGVNKSKIFYTTRDKENYKSSFKDIINISKLIKNNIYYKCPSEICNNCKYNLLCGK